VTTFAAKRKLSCMLDVRRLRVLREVAARGTLAAAAEALAYTPSAVSQQISVLEREAGVPLLERAGRGVRLTSAARRLVAHTEAVLAQLEQAEADLAAADGTVRGTVIVGSFPTGARAVIPPAVRALRSAHPEVRVVLHELEPHESLPRLRLGELDVAVVHSYDLLPRRDEPGIMLTPLLDDPLWVALPPGHPADGPEVRLADLRGERWVGGHPDTSCYAIVLRSCALAGYAPEVDFHSNDFAVVLGLVEAGLGVALVPQLALHGMSTSASLRPVAEMPLSRRISAAVRRGTAEHPAVRATVAALRATTVPQDAADRQAPPQGSSRFTSPNSCQRYPCSSASA
jgi:DNA-binding transcriptional LysR family regulator